MVFYRKYRPQTLDELIGQEQIKQTLKKAFETGKLAHAYLFCGPRGSGKTSTARILAKMVNCERGVLNQKETSKQIDSAFTFPCNKCSSCLSITDGSNLDLIEIDAASNRGIDDIRELRERIKLAPTFGKKKVYIIDEVHMLTTEAFNALLKTLEEPPEHVLFILATTELHKVPQTIMSRVQKLDFKLAQIDDLITALKRVVEAEKIAADQNALQAIAKCAEGSFRDGLKLLDQLSALGEKITLEMVEKMVRSGNFSQAIELLEAIAARNSFQALKITEDQVQNGVSIKEFTSSLLEILRVCLFIKARAFQVIKDEQDEQKFELINQLSGKFTQFELLSNIEQLQKSLEAFKYTSIPSLPLEVAIVSSCEPQSFKPTPVIQEIIQKSDVVSVPTVRDVETVGLSGGGVDITAKVIKKEEVSGQSSQEIATLKDKWNYILETIKPDNFSLEALLKQAKLLGFENGLVILEVPYAFHQRILESPRSKNLLESVLSDILGKPARIATRIGKRPVRIEELANVELAQDDEIVRIAAEIFNS